MTPSRAAGYHTIFLDAGGTLIRANPSVGAVYVEVAARYGILAGDEEVERRARSAFRRLREKELARGEGHTASLERAKAWWRRVVRESFGPAADSPRFEAFFQAVFDEFARPERYAPYPEAERTLDRLAAAGPRLGILSNWDARLRPILEGLGLARRFATIVISGEAGVEKPDPRIYALARRAAGAGPADRTLLVGDNPKDDFEGARAAGFEARLLRRDRGQTLETLLEDLFEDA